MKKNIFLLFCLGFSSLAIAQQDERKPLPKETQIKIALQAAPADLREGAKVYGYDETGKFIVLQEAFNNSKMVCLAPDFKMSTYYAYAYPQSLDPFMERGRQLIAEGKRKERDAIREQEFKEGKLVIPQTPTILYGYWGKASDVIKETGEIKDAQRRYVIYMPFAKAEDIGLSSKHNNLGTPWLMDEGGYKAHIMITPPMEHNHGK
ncbi:hypothetical protein FAZ19_11710 [Sphingobacterium alkalisoli]|uniref:Uncharacterized protein n=1 Tax=Sphingobacterium alkalisoli TaxID=1874115 RepID=A0A4U0H2R3_9SPHI|nr:hypothetical protein [Sphingobacterium alkalisoli]TJY65778.1 hypothetical protein FAZ19_11710 [Sphingobacterium alkalisoli]GGH18376.1 hypothetical protein GCM10011418_21960 [Sphingobacterium alkalisoli]